MKLVILDRDGVINYDSDFYIKSPEEWIPIPRSLNAIAKLTKAGFKVAICTNQSGIGRGLYDEAMLSKIHDKLMEHVVLYGGEVDKIFYCPHHPDDNCECRKPKPGMLNQVAKHFDVSLKNVPFIGDSIRDLQAAQAVEARPILVLTGYGQKSVEKIDKVPNAEVFDNLALAVEMLIKEQTLVN